MGFEIVGDKLIKYTEELNVKNVIIPDGVKIIGAKAFFECDDIENIVIPDSVTEIEDSAFEDCDNLKNMIIPESVKIIGKNILDSCDMENLTIYDNIERIERNDFLSYSIDSMTIRGKKISVTINENYYTFRGDFMILSSMIFCFLCADIDKKEEIVFKKIKYFHEKILLVIYLFFEYGSERAEDYIYRYSDFIIDTLIDNNEHELLAMLIPHISISENNIDAFISNAINSKHTEIQVILMHYKNDNFGFDKADFDEYMIE